MACKHGHNNSSAQILINPDKCQDVRYFSTAYSIDDEVEYPHITINMRDNKVWVNVVLHEIVAQELVTQLQNALTKEKDYSKKVY